MIVDAEGEPVGYVHLKDVLRAAEGPDAATDVVRPIPAQADPPDGAGAARAPTSRTRSRSCAAPAATWRAVRNEDGETTAVLFLEDIIEELVGEVQDATRRRA